MPERKLFADPPKYTKTDLLLYIQVSNHLNSTYLQSEVVESRLRLTTSFSTCLDPFISSLPPTMNASGDVNSYLMSCGKEIRNLGTRLEWSLLIRVTPCWLQQWLTS